MGHKIAEAIFASPAQPSQPLSDEDYRRLVRQARRCCGGSNGCVARMAEEFGAHPDEAARRMLWALSIEAHVDRRRKQVAA